MKYSEDMSKISQRNIFELGKFYKHLKAVYKELEM